MADTATQSLEYIRNSGEFELVRDIPVFDEHDEWDEQGNLLRRFDAAKLTLIAQTSNARRATGDLSPIGPGHTVSDQTNPKTGQVVYKAKETDQPDIYGYVGELKVGKYGPSGKTAILADFYMKRQVSLPDGRKLTGKQALAEFPRRSIELWYADNTIDWVALLRRAPQRDLGLTVAPTGPAQYAKALQSAPWDALQSAVFSDKSRTRRLPAAYSLSGKLRYAMEDSPVPDMNDPTAPPDANAIPQDPAPAAGAGGDLSPEDAGKAMSYAKHIFSNHPLGKYLHTKYSKEAGCEDAPVDAPPVDAAAGVPVPPPAAPATPKGPDQFAMASPTNATMPAAPAAEPDKNARKGEPDKYAMEMNALRQQNEMLARKLNYSKALTTLRENGCEFDFEVELNDSMEMGPEQFAKHLDRVRRCSPHAPVGGPMLQTEVPANPAAEMSQELLNRRLNYMRTAQCTWGKAVETIK